MELAKKQLNKQWRAILTSPWRSFLEQKVQAFANAPKKLLISLFELNLPANLGHSMFQMLQRSRSMLRDMYHEDSCSA
jgi:hypothetical protein